MAGFIKNKKGMTLVELLVSMAILGIVIGIGFSLFGYGTNMFKHSGSRASLQFMLREASDRISRELRVAETVELLSTVPGTFDNSKKYIYVKTDSATGKKSVIHRVGAAEKVMSGELEGNVSLDFEARSSGKMLYFNISGSSGAQSYNINSQLGMPNLGSSTISGASGTAVCFGPMSDSEMVLSDTYSVTVTPSNLSGTILNLMTTGPASSSITWSSSSPEVTSITGGTAIVTRSDITDATIILTAVFTKGSASGTKTYTLLVPRVQPIVLNRPTLPYARKNSSYSFYFTASGGDGTYVYSGTGIPYGMYLSQSGQLTGRPSSAGTYTLDITVSDSTGHSDSALFDLIVDN